MLSLHEQLEFAILSVLDEFFPLPLDRTTLTSLVEGYDFKREDVERHINLMLVNNRLRLVDNGRVLLAEKN